MRACQVVLLGLAQMVLKGSAFESEMATMIEKASTR